MPSVWEVGQCMSPHLYLESQLMRPLARVETGLGSHPALRPPRQSQPKGIFSAASRGPGSPGRSLRVAPLDSESLTPAGAGSSRPGPRDARVRVAHLRLRAPGTRAPTKTRVWATPVRARGPGP